MNKLIKLILAIVLFMLAISYASDNYEDLQAAKIELAKTEQELKTIKSTYGLNLNYTSIRSSIKVSESTFDHIEAIYVCTLESGYTKEINKELYDSLATQFYRNKHN